MSKADDPLLTSPSLIQRVKARDADAWSKFVDLYGPLVYQWCRRFDLTDEDASDVVQEVFYAVAGKVGSFRRNAPGGLRAWLWAITRNKVRDRFRRCADPVRAEGGTDAQRRLAEIPQLPPNPPEEPHPSSGFHGPEARAIELVRASVEARTWSAFWEVTAKERPVPHVAEELGMTVRAVYEAKYRVRRRIREQLAELLD